MQKISVFLVNLLLLSGVSDAEEIEENLTLLVGDTAILNSGFPKISSSDTVQWMFGKERIAEIRNGQKLKSVVPPENLIKRLQLNETTGSLNITNVNINHSGTYMLEIRSRNTITKTFTVIVTDELHLQSVMEGYTVTLLTHLKNIKSYQIRLRFNNQVIYLNGITESKWSNIRLDVQSKELNITNIQSNQAGLYDVEVENNDNIMIFHKKCKIIVERNSGVSPGAAAGIIVGLLVFHWCLQL